MMDTSTVVKNIYESFGESYKMLRTYEKYDAMLKIIKTVMM